MGEILSEMKQSIIRGFKREKSEKEHEIEAVGVFIIIILALAGLYFIALAPVAGEGELTFSTNDPVFKEFLLQNMDLPPEEVLISSTGSGFNVTVKGRFSAPAFVFSALAGR
ncbi:hypothetical protein [Candidatus Methanoperedens nitratireducens]|uniref:Uncharacterized protein n=1 Tax=Candidatus Methanoperedens nitratireducens TaxID=1392998 RepID=A0A284VNL4_9EURY|nr:hypothetical protein [Candidatus Methanoperedens nitroreducens]SNQ60870.1 hypothetical protein MNV_2060012 [Candidatus Methanoperedens nitroreducens]